MLFSKPFPSVVPYFHDRRSRRYYDTSVLLLTFSGQPPSCRDSLDNKSAAPLSRSVNSFAENPARLRSYCSAVSKIFCLLSAK